jgi:hypothetical protein
MKKYILFIVVFIFFVLSGSMAQTKTEKAVAEAAEKFRLAMVSGSKEDLEFIIMEQLSYGHSGGQVDNKKEFIDKFITGKSDFVTIRITEQTIQIIKKTAIVRHILFAETNDNNKPSTVKLKVILVFVKSNGQWKLAARQAVKQA